MPVEGGEPVQITSDSAIDCCPSWSPDGKEIAFHSFRTGNRDIFVVSSDGGTARQLTSDPGQDRYPRWSPDGTNIVFPSERSGRREAYVLSKYQGEMAGQEARQLTFEGGLTPSWSPDGRLIAFAHAAQGGIGVIRPDGEDPRRLTEFGIRPMWAPDSQTIYFRVQPPDERAGFWSVSVSGGDPMRLVRFDEPSRPPTREEYASDGERFYFTLTEHESDVWVMELAPNSSK